jgi:hypothetical protein
VVSRESLKGLKSHSFICVFSVASEYATSYNSKQIAHEVNHNFSICDCNQLGKPGVLNLPFFICLVKKGQNEVFNRH